MAIFSISGSFSLLLFNKPDIYHKIVIGYVITEYIVFSIMLSHFYINKFLKKLVLISILPFLIFILFYLDNSKSNFLLYPLVVEFLSFILFLTYFFYEKISIENMSPIYSTIKFWICVGLFVYFTGNFFYILLVENSKNASQEVKNQLTIIYCVVTITKNLILGLAFLNKDEVGKEGEDGSDFSDFPKDINFDSISKNHHLI